MDQAQDSKPLTVTQRKVLRFIRDHIQSAGYCPSMTEIGTGTGLASTMSVSYQLNKLEEMGYLTRDRRIPRSIRLDMNRISGLTETTPPA